MSRVELIYDADCPNVGATRAALLKAFHALSIEPRWVEWDRSDPESPAEIRACASPTIWVGGIDVAGNTEALAEGACRLYRDESGRLSGIPSDASIVDALRRSLIRDQVGLTPDRRTWWTSLAALPAMGAALIPVGLCPACWPAYLGFLGSAGAGALVESRNLLPLTTGLFGLSLVSLGYRAGRRHGYGPLWLGGGAMALLLVSKFAVSFDPGVYAGIFMLLAASAWNAWPKGRAARANESCPQCAEIRTNPIRKDVG
jgi:hypothetical protein